MSKNGGDHAAIEELERFAKSMAAGGDDDDAPPKGKKGKADDDDRGGAGDGDGADLGKSFALDDGTEVIDAAPMLKGMLARMEAMAEQIDVLTRAVTASGKIAMSMHKSVEAIGSAGRGRRSEVTQPAGGAAPAVAGAPVGGGILMKSLKLVEEGRLSAADVSEIEMHVRNGKAPPARFNSVLGIGQQS